MMSDLIARNGLAMLGHAAPRNPSPNRLDRPLSRHLLLRHVAGRTSRTPGHHRADRRQPCFAARAEHLEFQCPSVGHHDRGRSAIRRLRGARLAFRQTLASLGRSIPVDHGCDASRLCLESGHPQPSLSINVLPSLFLRTGGDHLGRAPEGRAEG